MIRDLIYDIGMHDGRDTRHYLSAGYRVVAVEANPELAANASEMFAREIEAGQLVIVEKAIGEARGTTEFWINDDNSEHSSLFERLGARNESRHHIVEVETIPFEGLIEEFGVPFYLKVDIEAGDGYCLAALKRDDLPVYVSVEARSLEHLMCLASLGYEGFKVIDQMTHAAVTRLPSAPVVHAKMLARDIATRAARVAVLRRAYRKIARLDGARAPSAEPLGPGSSGPFAEGTAGEWLSVDRAAYLWLGMSLSPLQATWWDFHAKRPETG